MHNNYIIYTIKQKGLYQNKVNIYLALFPPQLLLQNVRQTSGKSSIVRSVFICYYYFRSLRNFDLERRIKGLFLAAVITIHLLNIVWTEVTSLANGHPCFLGSYGSLPWPLRKFSLPVMHDRFVVVGKSQAVNISMAILLKIVPLF